MTDELHDGTPLWLRKFAEDQKEIGTRLLRNPRDDAWILEALADKLEKPTCLPRVVKSRSVQRVLTTALDLLDKLPDEVFTYDNDLDRRQTCVEDLQALIAAGFL